MAESMRMEAALAALAVILAAGCIETNPPPFVTAQFHALDAWQAALAWDSDARLVRVASVEAREGEDSLENANRREAAMFGRDDPRPGDGVATGWFYEFQAADPARPSLLATFARAGVSVSETDQARPTKHAIGAWPIDSNHASAIAIADVADWDRHQASPRLEVGHALLSTHEGDGAVWLWLADDHSTGWSAARIVDALTGEVRAT